MVTWSVNCPNCKVEVLIDTVDRSADCDGDNITCANGCSLYYFITANETMSLQAYACEGCETTKAVKSEEWGNFCEDCTYASMLTGFTTADALRKSAPIGAVIRDEHGNEYRIIDSAWNIEPVEL